MTDPTYTGGRLRNYFQFLAAFLYLFFARSLALHGARGLVSDAWIPLAEQAMLVFLLLIGYSAMGFWMDGQVHPVHEQGLPLRPGCLEEAGLGLGLRAAPDRIRRHRHFLVDRSLFMGQVRSRRGILRALRSG